MKIVLEVEKPTNRDELQVALWYLQLHMDKITYDYNEDLDAFYEQELGEKNGNYSVAQKRFDLEVYNER